MLKNISWLAKERKAIVYNTNYIQTNYNKIFNYKGITYVRYMKNNISRVRPDWVKGLLSNFKKLPKISFIKSKYVNKFHDHNRS